jgi:CubicO group peptidase (beta-lactamase class C family)
MTSSDLLSRRALVKRTAAACAALALLAPAFASGQSPRNAAVDRVFAQWDTPGSPGCALGVVRGGRLLYERGYGMANLDYDIPNGPTMVYYIGSDSKQFTAAAVALLSLRGQLSLDDDLRKYFPELPDYGTPVRIRHLIHHTSGLRDIYTLMSLRGDRLEDVFPDSQALALIARQRGLAFTPGSAYSYSNTGYFLLAQLVKRVSGRSLREFADAEIFRPLGMTNTHFHDDPGHVMKNRAMSYEPDGKGGFVISYLQNFDKVGAGGLYSTVHDLQRRWAGRRCRRSSTRAACSPTATLCRTPSATTSPRTVGCAPWSMAAR